MLNDEQRAHLEALATARANAPETVCACGWDWTAGCRLSCIHKDKQRPEDRAYMEGYQAGKDLERRRAIKATDGLIDTWGKALPESDPARSGGRLALRALAATLRDAGYIIGIALVLAAGTAQAREPETRKFYDERGRNTGRAETRSDGVTKFYDERNRPTGRMECSGDRCKVYDERGRLRGSMRTRPVEPQSFNAPLVTFSQWAT